MKELQTLQYHPTVEVRMVMQDGELWWVLLDVCKVLGMSEPHRVAARLDEDERTQSTVIDSIGRKQETTIVNESGLYSVILRSDKPEAKAFKRWITHEVLPSIRRTGTYSVKGVHQTNISSPTLPPYMEPLRLSVAAQHLLHKLQEIDSYNSGDIQISNRKLTRLLGLGSNNTLIAARKELIQAGYIEFSPGVRSNPSIYRLKRNSGLAQMQNI